MVTDVGLVQVMNRNVSDCCSRQIRQNRHLFLPILPNLPISPSALSLSLSHTHTHTHTHIRLYLTWAMSMTQTQSNPYIIMTSSDLQTGARAPKTSTSKQLTRRMTALERTLHDIQASLERLEEEVEDISHAGPSFCLGRWLILGQTGEIVDWYDI